MENADNHRQISYSDTTKHCTTATAARYRHFLPNCRSILHFLECNDGECLDGLLILQGKAFHDDDEKI